MENWYEKEGLFQEFNEEVTKVWIEVDLTKEAAKEWLWVGANWKNANKIAWMRDQQQIATLQRWNELTDEQIKELANKWIEYCKENNFHHCDHCAKVVTKDLMFFSDWENNLDISDKSRNLKYFCSEHCQQKYVKDSSEENQDWATIHPDFAKKEDSWSRQTYQQEWEGSNLTSQDAHDFVAIGFEPNDYWKVLKWKKTNFTIPEIKKWFSAGLDKWDYDRAQGWKNKAFTPAQTKEWISAGLRFYEYELTAYLRANNYTPSTAFLTKSQAQHWLAWQYPQVGTCLREKEAWYSGINNFGKIRSEITHLDFARQNLSGSLDLSDFINLERLNCASNQLSSIALNNCVKLTSLDVNNNELTSLNVNSCVKLAELKAEENQLKELVLPTINKLREIQVSQNQLTTLNYSTFNPTTLTKLDLAHNNFAATDLTVFSKLINLTGLYIGHLDEWIKDDNLGNQFFGSFKVFQNCTKLKHLSVLNINLSADLEYLPLSLKQISCNGQIEEELRLDGNNLIYFRLRKQKLSRTELNKLQTALSRAELNRVTTIPAFLEKELKELTKLTLPSENYDQKFNYNHCLLDYSLPFKLEVNKKRQLPLRLYNLTSDLVENSNSLYNNTNYIALSYCWGTNWEKNFLGIKKVKSYGQSYQIKLTKLGRKALNKVKATYKFLKKENTNFPDYIWIDNFCINQNDKIEKGREVTSQKNYYSNATITLIAIDAKIGNEIDKNDQVKIAKQTLTKIVQSPWFHRSWTFQEGLLSKQTIFMFDDHLVDGRSLALAWVGWQKEGLSSSLTLKTTPHVYITPLGWSYSPNESQAVNLTLPEALHSVKHRQQTVPIDGIYSILGLLPYGHLFPAKYKEKDCHCSMTEKENCGHWATYSSDYLQSILRELAVLAIKKGYGKETMFSWDLTEDADTHWPFTPKIDLTGSTNISFLGEDLIHRMISKIKIVNLQGFSTLAKIYLDINWGNQEVKFKDFKIILPKDKSQGIVISSYEEIDYYLYSLRSGQSQESLKEFFIDVINREVILKAENPILCYQQTSSLKTKVELVKKNLTGILDLSEFINLEELHCYQNNLTSLLLPTNEKMGMIYCGENQLSKIEINNFLNLIHLGVNNNQLTELDINNNHKLVWLNCSNNSLNNLDISKNIKLTELYCHYNDLEQINLINNINLKKLWSGNNQLISLDLTGLVELEFINVNDCYLTSFNYTFLNPDTLTHLNISDNNLQNTNIEVFSHLVNLETLWIGSWDEDSEGIGVYSERIKQNIYNHFYGSLESWKNLTKLKFIEISNTDITSGVEFLPISIEEVLYSTKERPACQLKQIEQEITAWLERKEQIEQEITAWVARKEKTIAEQTNLVTSVEQS